MRYFELLTHFTVASAIVLPKDGPFSLKDTLRHPGSLINEVQNTIASSIDEGFDAVSSIVENAILDSKIEVESAFREEFEGAPNTFRHDSDVGSNLEDHDFSNLTIYELISKSNKTTKFFELISRYDDIVKLLNDTEKSYTLFVPTDEAFEHLPEHKKPSDEVIHNALLYHIGLGSYPAGDVIASNTIPTVLKEKFLGDNPQRLRTNVNFSGVHINVYSKIVAANFKAKNGYIHAVNKVLIPPLPIGPLLSLFPSEFSTLLLAYEKTNFVEYVHGLKLFGSTVFAPSNKAWERLGPAANAFLFNTEKGKGYLKALLKYQIVPNTTLYSDEIYHGEAERISVAELATDGHLHIQLPTLLSKDVSVDIYTWKLWTSIVVNGAVGVEFLDGIGKNGVVQVVKDVPTPHGKAGDGRNTWDGYINVEDLKHMLKEFVEEDEIENEIGDL